MAIYYADSSVLVKRHVVETGSLWVQALMHPSAGNTIIVASITRVEVLSAMHRRRRETPAASALYATLVRDFTTVASAQYSQIPITDAVLEEAGLLVERYPLRAYDAVHLATALATQAMLMLARQHLDGFLSADISLLNAAQAEGLSTDNPNNH